MMMVYVVMNDDYCRNITGRDGEFEDFVARRTPPENEPNHSTTPLYYGARPLAAVGAE